MWNLPPPPDFQELREDKRLEVYQRNPPHWRQQGATYFVTFRLGDALPQSKLSELSKLRDEFERRHPSPWPSDIAVQYARQVIEQVERWLDQDFGSCLLRTTQSAKFVVDAMHYFDLPDHQGIRETGSKNSESRYELGCYVVMPNHVHVIVRPLLNNPLEEIIKSWKQYSSTRINRAQATTGEIWQPEAFDRIIRDEEHLWRVIQYIGRNPTKARLARNEATLWLRPDWQKLGWKFEHQLCPLPP